MIVASIGISILLMPAAGITPQEWDNAYNWADKKIQELSLDEKLDFTVGYSEFFFHGFPQKGVPHIYLSDATQGVHIRRNLKDTTTVRQLDKSTAFPAPIMLAATFNPALAYAYGKAVGEECRYGNIGILLGPGVNIARNSQNGRNYEYLGEDPLLAGIMAAEYIRGLQSQGTAACVKHFIGNETEFYRRRSNSLIDNRALHEIYMKPFKMAIDADVAFVMTSYNKLNGEWTGESRFVIDTLLRRNLGFRGSVMTDWRSVYNNLKTVKSGQNTIMPGSDEIREDIRQWVETGALTESDIDMMIRPVLATCYVYGLYNPSLRGRKYGCDFTSHSEVAKQTAEEGVVLLKNNGILPLKVGKNRKILVTGLYLNRNLSISNSSADVEGYEVVSFTDALKNEFGNEIEVIEKPSDEQIKEADVVITSTGTIDREAYERPFELPDAETARLNRILRLNANVIMVAFTGSGIRMTDFIDNAAALIYGWYPGQNGMEAVAGVISGRVNPSGKLPFTIEKDFTDSPAYGTMPKKGKFYTKIVNESLIIPYDVNYDESILVGYRWYDTKNIQPLFPFGYGLSYTDWEITNSKIRVKDGKLLISSKVKNVGKIKGKQSIQVYVSEISPSVTRPVKELKGFDKVEVAPGNTAIAEISIDLTELGYYDDKDDQWKLNPGEYMVSIGTSSKDIFHQEKIKI